MLQFKMKRQLADTIVIKLKYEKIKYMIVFFLNT